MPIIKKEQRHDPVLVETICALHVAENDINNLIRNAPTGDAGVRVFMPGTQEVIDLALENVKNAGYKAGIVVVDEQCIYLEIMFD